MTLNKYAMKNQEFRPYMMLEGQAIDMFHNIIDQHNKLVEELDNMWMDGFSFQSKNGLATDENGEIV